MQEVIEVDLPRPRKIEMLTSKRYAQLKKKALSILYKEAVSAFAKGESVASDMVEALDRARSG